jgi:hypothetical protein
MRGFPLVSTAAAAVLGLAPIVAARRDVQTKRRKDLTMPDESFTLLRARPYPGQASERLTAALAQHGVDAQTLYDQISGRAELTRDPDSGETLLTINDPVSRDGVEAFRELIDALRAEGANVYAYCDIGVEYPGTAEFHRASGESVRLTWCDREPLLDEQTLIAAASDGPHDQRSLSELPDAAIGGAARRLLGAFKDAP